MFVGVLLLLLRFNYVFLYLVEVAERPGGSYLGEKRLVAPLRKLALDQSLKQSLGSSDERKILSYTYTPTNLPAAILYLRGALDPLPWSFLAPICLNIGFLICWFFFWWGKWGSGWVHGVLSFFFSMVCLLFFVCFSAASRRPPTAGRRGFCFGGLDPLAGHFVCPWVSHHKPPETLAASFLFNGVR